MELKSFLKYFADSNSNVTDVIIKSEGKDILFAFEGAKGNRSRNGMVVPKQALLRSDGVEDLEVVYAGIEDGKLFLVVE